MSPNQLCRSISETLPALFECSPAPQQGVRVRTPLMYPDGGIVDVFVLEHGGQYRITDFGEALGWLRMQSQAGRRSPNQNRMIEDTCQTLGVELHRGQLILSIEGGDISGEAVLRLAQAVVRVSDLWFTLRKRPVETTAVEVNNWLKESKIPFQRSVGQAGRSGRNWTIDYRTDTNKRISLVLLLSTNSRASVRRLTEHVLAGWVDLNYLRTDQPKLTFVSLFDDKDDMWQDNDFGLLEPYSEVARWSQRDKFERILKSVPPRRTMDSPPLRTI